MNARRLTTFCLLCISFLFAWGCYSINYNRDAVFAVRRSIEVPDRPTTKGKIIFKLRVNSHNEGRALAKKLAGDFSSKNGRHTLGVNFNYDETTKMVSSGASAVVLTHDGLLLTNHHVTLTDPDRLEIVLKRGKNEVALRGQLVAYSRFKTGNDLAVVKVDAHFKNVAHLGRNEQIRVSRNIYNWGFPFGFSPASCGKNYFAGHISIQKVHIPFFGRQSRFLMSIRGIGGVSGSGIFARDGRLIGLMQGHSGNRLWMVGIPIDQIRNFLDTRGISYSG